MDREARGLATDFGWGLVLLGAVLEIIGVLISGSGRRDSHDLTFDEDAASAHRGLFDGEESARVAYTIYGREPVTAGRSGEPVGAYSGAPIVHY